MAIYLQPNCMRNLTRNKIFTSEEIRIITTNLHLNCAEDGLQTWLTPPQGCPTDTNKACNMSHSKSFNSCNAIRHTSYLFLILVYTWIAPNEGIRVVTLGSQSICTDYGLETWLVKSDEISVLELDTSGINRASEHELAQLMMFMYLLSKYSLSVRNMSSIYDSL